ncbi:uncharacterized RNA-binding protein C1827.05c [Eurytemora carolleeae]|uniref:uncharacterized RNA-binding protein C1827.05c n=1 Tax=Eurytemora carolleeae TaxID=1294199 RepID=UPI000C7593C0|nr:uncharacterized RNA-binding protein C1827.05c [Eurytemora carolleeae]|eukprot:XP_023336138.1 uncharacterized RNA-binding protein C1827.05c-like [Eurytemora affinis]
MIYKSCLACSTVINLKLAGPPKNVISEIKIKMGKKVKAASARKPVPAKIEKISKSKKPMSVVTKETIDKVLPSVETDAVLKEISVKSQAAERKEEKEEGAHEKVKVKRKDSLIKSTEKNAKKLKKDSVEKENTETIPADPELQDKSYLSLDNPAEDDKKIKVPSYSYKKNRGVVYISHIPHGFYEAQMREFFSQFGTITNLRYIHY